MILSRTAEGNSGPRGCASGSSKILKRQRVRISCLAALLLSVGFAPTPSRAVTPNRTSPDYRAPCDEIIAGRIRDEVSRVVTPRIPAEAAAMLELAVRAVNLHRPETVASFATPEAADAFAWSASKNHDDWKAQVLPVPGDTAMPAAYLAVFHTFHTCESDGDHVYPLVPATVASRATWKLGTEILETATLGLRVRDHAIDASIDVPSKTVALRDTIAVERTDHPPTVRDPGAFGLLRISDDFRIRSLRLAGEEIPYEQAGGVIAFVPPTAGRFALALEYSGKLNHQNGDFIHDDEAVIASYWYPHIARLPATLSITATAPPGWTAVAQGEPGDVRVNPDGSQTTAWHNELPTSFFTLDMGRYTVTNRQWKGRLLSVYLLDDKPDVMARTARESLDMLQASLAFYDRVFGVFPYRRYAVVETHGPFSGALEAYSFATFGPRTLPDYIPHELAHTWWGGLVPCAYTRSMWNEAFANYSDDLFRRSTPVDRNGVDRSSEALADRLETRKQAFRGYASIPIARAFDTDDDPQNAVGYGKGARVLRVLEEQIGQETILNAMRAFVAHHARGEVAEWAEFEAAVNQVTGQDLHWFFAQWLERTGAPRVELTDITVRTTATDTWVDGRIRQAGPVYRMKLPVAVELRSGSTVRLTVETQEADTPFHIRVMERPDRIRLDPEALVPMEPASRNNPKGDPFTVTLR